MSRLSTLAAALLAAALGTAAGAFTVVIDPGHGGHDPGAEAQGVREAHLVLSMAERLAAELQGPGVTVHLTRHDDSFVSLDDRVDIARAHGADLLVSIHADALVDGRAAGLSVYSFDPARGDWADAARRSEVAEGAWIAGAATEGLDRLARFGRARGWVS